MDLMVPLQTVTAFEDSTVLYLSQSKVKSITRVGSQGIHGQFFFFHQTHYHAVSSCEGNENKTDNHVGITQELNSTGKLTYIAGNVWFYALGARTCFSAA